MKVNQVFEVAAPPERVGEILSCEAFCLEGERIRDGVVSCSYVLIEESAARRVYELRTVEHKRSMTGGLDKATLNTLNKSTWDRGARTLTWVYVGQESERIKVSGVYRMLPTATGTRVDHDVTVEVAIPLLGGQVAKLIAKGFEAAFPGVERRLKDSILKS
jgi:hypothetical protein